MTVVELHAGDRVAGQADYLAYEVCGVEVQQGRVQVADTVGEVHCYHRDDTVVVIRAPSPGL